MKYHKVVVDKEKSWTSTVRTTIKECSKSEEQFRWNVNNKYWEDWISCAPFFGILECYFYFL